MAVTEKEGMLKSYKSVYRGGSAEIVEKKSRFIAHIAPAANEYEAAEFIEKIKKEYWDARHNCHAFCVGLYPQMSRCSDDGEPAQTAGKPMLDVLLGAQLMNTVVVVTRYFGGTLLGTGGLVRAYSQAVKEGLAQCQIIEKQLCRRAAVSVDYTFLGKLQYMTAGSDIMILGTDYTDKARMEMLIPTDSVGSFEKKLADASSGQVHPEDLGLCYGAIVEDQVMVFDD